MLFRVTIRKEGKSDEVRMIEAASRFAVYDQVRSEGGFVVSIAEKHGFNFHFLSRYNLTFGSGIPRREIIRVAKNLSAMLSAGLSISRALNVVERQSSNKRLKAVAVGLSDAIRRGSSFHEALALYPKVFPEIFIAMSRAGEASGSLVDSLSLIALQLERQDELVRKIRGAMIYPAIVITAVLIVGVLMLIYVVPTLTSTFESLGVKVPLATRIIVALSNFMINNAALMFALILMIVVGGIFFVRSKTGSAFVLATALHAPIVGDLVRETYTARAARTLSSLLSAGVPVLEALSIAKSVVHAAVFAEVIHKAEGYVQKGDPLSKSFSENTKLYPILMSDMLMVGEETGKVADMLRQIAEFYEGDVTERTKNLSTIIEPMLMIVVGVFVGIFAVSMIAPIYQLSSAI